MLIVEDGSIVVDADSYVTLGEGRDIARLYGWKLPEDNTEAEQALRNGATYTLLYENRFSGRRTSPDQSLSFPRIDAVNIFGFDVDGIPKQVKHAQVAAAVDYGLGDDVRASSDGRSVASEEVVGAVKQSFFNSGKKDETIEITKAVDQLKPLLVNSGSAYSFNVCRG